MEAFDIAVRLLAATLAGAAIGLNRDLHGKPTGVALIVMASDGFAASTDWSAISRVIQGVITGIGFLGAGVIVRRGTDATHVHGLTTAACIWLTACLGVVCAIGAWIPIVVALTITFIVLVIGGPLEKLLHRWLGSSTET